MGLVDWTPEPTSSVAPGIYLAQVKTCELKTSKKPPHSRYFNVMFVLPGVGEEDKILCFDILMIEGKGRSIGQGKLKALGFNEGDPLDGPQDLIGRRAWIALKLESFEGKDRLKVDISADGSTCGYWSEDNPPPASTSSVAPIDEDCPW